MSVLVLGLNHKTAPVELLERVAVPEDRLQKAFASVLGREHVSEAVILSTCNRVEVYASVSRYHGGLSDLRGFMGEWAGLAPEDFVGHTYDYFDEGAAAHLFAVASGMDSMVVGERQINLQVKQAFKAAQGEQAVGRLLQKLFSQTLHAARRVRTETRIGEGGASMVDLGLELAADDLGTLEGRDVLVIGAGKIGGMAAGRLAERVGTVRVANRSPDRAGRLVERLGAGARSVAMREVGTVLADVDLVVASTGSPSPLVTRALLDRSAPGGVADRSGRPLVLLDLGVPRDIDPALSAVPGVTVRNVEDLRGVITSGPSSAEFDRAGGIIAEEAAGYAAWRRSVNAEPTIRALRARAESVRRTELDRLAPRLGELDDRQREAVEALSRGIVNTLLHEPTVRLKRLVDGEDAGQHALALRELFDLPD